MAYASLRDWIAKFTRSTAKILALADQSDRIRASLREAQSAAGLPSVTENAARSRAKENCMFLVLILGTVIALCALLWRVAIYALPVFVGFWTGWWALNHGAGIGCVPVGFVCGVGVFLLGRAAARSNSVWLHWLAVAVFVVPAAYTGFQMVNDLAEHVGPIWRVLLSSVTAVAVGGTTYTRLTNSGLDSDTGIGHVR